MSVQCHVLFGYVSLVSFDATALSEASAMCDPESFQRMAGRFKRTFQKTFGTSRSLTQLRITRRLTSAGTEAACLTTLLLLCFMRCVWRSPWQASPRHASHFMQNSPAKHKLVTAFSLHLHMKIVQQMAEHHLLYGCVQELDIVLQEGCQQFCRNGCIAWYILTICPCHVLHESSNSLAQSTSPLAACNFRRLTAHTET